MHEQGFTLIEVLVVIAVIGLLAALGIPRYLRWRDASSIRQVQAVITASLINVRTTAKRTNAARTVSWTASTFNGVSLKGVTITGTPLPVYGPYMSFGV